MIVIRQVPLYWGIETDSPDKSLVTKSWLLEDMPPWRESVWAFRIRVSHNRWLHVGRFRYRREALHSGLYFKPTTIGRWGNDVPEDPDDAWREWPDEIRPFADGGPGDGAGDELVQDGATVSGPAAPGTGSAVAGEPDEAGDRSGLADHSGVTT